MNQMANGIGQTSTHYGNRWVYKGYTVDESRYYPGHYMITSPAGDGLAWVSGDGLKGLDAAAAFVDEHAGRKA